MLFVSKFSNYTFIIRNALIKRVENEAGQSIELVVRPSLDVNFRPLCMSEKERVIAVRMFEAINPVAPWGAVAYPVEGTMGQEFGDLIMDVERYSGYNPAFNLSKWDSHEDIDFEAQGANTDDERRDLREMVEGVLLSNNSLNRDYIRLDEALPKPWPAYPTEATPGVAKKIVSLAKDFGIPFSEIVDYEKTQDVPRENVLAEVELEIAKQKAAAAEREALGAVIS